MKRARIEIAALLALCSCSPRVSDGELWRRSLAAQAAAPLGDRAPAEAPRCYRDRMEASVLTREIRAREEAVKLPPNHKFSFGLPETTGLVTTELSAASRLMLSLNDNIRGSDPEFGPQTWYYSRQSYAGCKDAACVVNGIYGKSTGPGEKLYWFWLETGYALAATNRFPLLSKLRSLEGDAIEPMLFSEKELDAFYLMAGLLPSSMRRLSALQTFHRLPRGSSFGDFNPKNDLTAAWIYGQPNRGHVLAADNCLEISPAGPRTSDYFYFCLIHEVGHAKDRSESVKNNDVPPSSTEAWLKLSGWKKESFVSPEGAVSESWTPVDTKPFVTSYGRSHPAEDYAEAVAWARLNGAELRKKSAAKHAFVTENAYAGRSYDTEGLLQYVTNAAKVALPQQLPDWMKECSADSATAFPTGPIVFTPSGVSPDLQRCLSARYLRWQSQAFASLRFYEPEGCNFLDAHGARVEADLKMLAAPLVEKYVAESQAMAEFLKLVQEFRQRLSAAFDARLEYLSCLENSAPQACYDSRLRTRFDAVMAESPSELRSSEAQERELFEKNNAWSRVETRVLEFYRGLLSGHEAAGAQSASNRWKECRLLMKASPPSAADPADFPTEPFSGGPRFVPASLLSCLNGSAAADLAEVRESLLAKAGLSVNSDAVRAWIDVQLLEPSFVRRLQELLEEEVRAMEKTWGDLTARADAVAKTRLENDVSWLAGAAWSAEACRVKAVSILAEQTRDASIELLPAEDLARAWATKFCARLQSTDSFREKAADAHEDAYRKELAPLLASLDDKVIEAAGPRIQQCRKNLLPFRRVPCLFEDKVDFEGQKVPSWTAVFKPAVRAFLKSNAVTELGENFPGPSENLSNEAVRRADRAELRERAKKILEEKK